MDIIISSTWSLTFINRECESD